MPTLVRAHDKLRHHVPGQHPHNVFRFQVMRWAKSCDSGELDCGELGAREVYSPSSVQHLASNGIVHECLPVIRTDFNHKPHPLPFGFVAFAGRHTPVPRVGAPRGNSIRTLDSKAGWAGNGIRKKESIGSGPAIADSNKKAQRFERITTKGYFRLSSVLEPTLCIPTPAIKVNCSLCFPPFTI
jgi:hypothetical protein